jgi:hypothetical protein
MKSNHRKKGSPITGTPTIRKYKDGTYTVWKDAQGKIHKRKTGHRNYTDANAPKGSRRKSNFANTTDGSGRVSHNR